MPVTDNSQTRVKQFLIQINAGEQLVGVMAVNDKRTFLEFQNTGANPCLIRFGERCQLDGSDETLAAFDKVTYSEPCPIERVSFYSVAGTTLSAKEGFYLL